MLPGIGGVARGAVEAFFAKDDRMERALALRLGSRLHARIGLLLVRVSILKRQCWPSAAWVAGKVGCGVATVWRAVRQLVGLGLLEREHGVTYDGKQSSNEYGIANLAFQAQEDAAGLRTAEKRAGEQAAYLALEEGGGIDGGDGEARRGPGEKLRRKGGGGLAVDGAAAG